MEPWQYERITSGNTYYLLFIADTNEDVSEGDETNNVASAPIPITLTVADIDLEVTGVAPAGTTVEIGAPATLNVTVLNNGPDAAGGVEGNLWAHVYASTDNVFDQWDDTWLGQYPLAGLAPLAGDSVSSTAALTFIPKNISAGDYYLFAQVNMGQGDYDYNRRQPETETANNTGVTANQVTFTAPTMDLQVTTVTAPAVATTGYSADVSWTVTNAGVSAAGVDSWMDSLYLSTDQTYSYNDVLVTSKEHTGGLAASASYTVNATVNLPHVQGAYLVVYTDSNNSQPESSDANNQGASPAIALTYAPGDLTITTATAPSAAEAGSAVTLSWTVTNREPNTIALGSWTDRVYLSDDDVYDANDTQINSRYLADKNIPAGETYTVTGDFTIPYRGGAYLLFVADDSENQPEVNEDNNIYPVAITVNYVPPNLVIETASVSGAIGKGLPVTVSWTAKNTGEGAAYGYWSDQVYLSEDNLLDANDGYSLDSVWQYGPYAKTDAPYNGSCSFSLPTSRAGNYLLVKADGYGDVAESVEIDNVYAIPVSYPSPDLVVESVSTSPATVGGTSRTFTVTYTVKNIDSTNSTTESYWYDYIYYSADNTLDTATDASLGSVYVQQQFRHHASADSERHLHEDIGDPLSADRRNSRHRVCLCRGRWLQQ